MKHFASSTNRKPNKPNRRANGRPALIWVFWGYKKREPEDPKKLRKGSLGPEARPGTSK